MVDINNILRALANENRLKILGWLKHPKEHFVSAKCDVQSQGVCVGLIEQKIDLSQSTVSQYLMQLHQADLITMERDGKWTYCKLNHKTIDGFIKELKTIL